jgi:release factor glutamine methyltransferase
MKWTIRGLIKTTTDFFRKKNIDEPRLTTELLLSHALGIKRVTLYLDFDKPLQEKELSVLRGYVKRRLAHEPVQYITGETGFMGIRIEVQKGVFIPRQETEILASEVKNWIDTKDSVSHSIFEIGTGTGALSLYLAKECENCHIRASDISEDALTCAQKNIENHGFNEKITLVKGDLFEPFKDSEKADIIVSNPPYIPTLQIETLPEVVKQEPREALDGGDDGLEFIKRLIAESPPHLKPDGFLAFEIGIHQATSVRELLEKEKVYTDITVIQDLRGIKRVVTAKTK